MKIFLLFISKFSKISLCSFVCVCESVVVGFLKRKIFIQNRYSQTPSGNGTRFKFILIYVESRLGDKDKEKWH